MAESVLGAAASLQLPVSTAPHAACAAPPSGYYPPLTFALLLTPARGAAPTTARVPTAVADKRPDHNLHTHHHDYDGEGRSTR
mmetsp:Transcript_10323/g.38029  ORF Transcript_10323/g.38029 Transcript_10323/m.38029 type:complete len:83 (-) Transcript_10323:3942-4190(-)